jgi:hypothetical protein
MIPNFFKLAFNDLLGLCSDFAGQVQMKQSGAAAGFQMTTPPGPGCFRTFEWT